MKAEGAGPKLRPKESFSNSSGGGWEEERLCKALLIKLIFII